MDDRIATGLWIEAKLRQLDQQAVSYYLINKGAYFSGAVILKINGLQNNCRVLVQIRDENARLTWSDIFTPNVVSEEKADDYIKRSLTRDADLWVIEIEDRNLQNIFDDG